jgi:hypothetical protein
MSTALSLPRCGHVVSNYESRGYLRMRETSLGVVMRHPNGGMVTVLANGETRAGDRAGPSSDSATAWWAEPSYAAPE